MSDLSVEAALRSKARLVAIESPAGCGKTFQGARYASEVVTANKLARVLVLTHTHAACDVFASQTKGSGGRADIRTIDSLINEIASIYHTAFGLPADTAVWARTNKNGYGLLAANVSRLLSISPIIARSIATRYPVVVCDEHQDASADQEAVVFALLNAGAIVRVFADPAQKIYEKSGARKKGSDEDLWENLKLRADSYERLEDPHRWSGEARPLGVWILNARQALLEGRSVDLSRNLPPGVSVIFAENRSPKTRGRYMLDGSEGRLIRRLVENADPLLVMATQNDTVEALHSFFFRSIRIWEGHIRDDLAELVDRIQQSNRDAAKVAQAVSDFLSRVATGLSPSTFSDTLSVEVRTGCVSRRSGRPAKIQALARYVLSEPDHRGVSKLLSRLFELSKIDDDFKDAKINHSQEFWDAVKVGNFEDASEGLGEILRRRAYSHPLPPRKSISTVHKAKGHECANVLIMPCDYTHFRDTAHARRLLYVAMSRAMQTLTFVVSRDNPTPLLVLPQLNQKEKITQAQV